MNTQTPPMEVNNIEQQPQQLRIWQQNTRKSLSAQLDLLVSVKRDYDLCAVQEPYIDFNNKSRANSQWIPIYPKNHHKNTHRSRSLLLINRNLATDSWTPLPIDSPDITAVQLQGDFGTIRVVNIYNDCKHNDSLTALTGYLRSAEAQQCPMLPLSYIWLGDFNRHHPLWDEERNNHLFSTTNLNLAQPLLDMLSRYNMKMALPKDIPTLKASSTGNHTRVDNVFCSDHLLNAIISCDTSPEQRPPKADHYPIITTFDITIAEGHQDPRPNFRLTNWEQFVNTLKQKLEGLACDTEIDTITEFNQRLDALNIAVNETIVQHVPNVKPSPYTKRWWTKDLAIARKATQKLARKAFKARFDNNDPIHEQHRQARNQYSESIRTAKIEHWIGWLEGLDETSVWDASRLVTGPASDGGRTRVPMLQVVDPTTKRVLREATTNVEKGKLLFETFFPAKPGESSVPVDTIYPPPKWTFENITDEQIHRAINKMQPYKATRVGTAPNCVLKNTSHILVPHLAPLFRATNNLGYYPADWALTQTLVLKKPGKPNYSTPGAWRPIVLSNGFARLLNSCQTADIVTMCESLDILPNNHFGARPGRTTTDSLHSMTKIVKDAWRQGKVASILYLDVKGAFPSVAVDRLIHNMRTRGIPEEYTKWMERRLAGRQTTIHFDDYQTPLFHIDNGLDQGDPFSGICYLIYNADLLKIPILRIGEHILLFVDDAAIIVVGRDLFETHQKLRNIMQREGGIFEWARLHNCEFGVEKFQLTDMTRQMVPHTFIVRKWVPIPRRNLQLGNQVITSKTSAKFLGVIVDNTLRWKEQSAAALAKGHDWIIQFGRLAKPTKGVSRGNMRRLYLAIAVPRMLYAADVFLTPQTHTIESQSAQKSNRTIIQRLAGVQ